MNINSTITMQYVGPRPQDNEPTRRYFDGVNAAIAFARVDFPNWEAVPTEPNDWSAHERQKISIGVHPQLADTLWEETGFQSKGISDARLLVQRYAEVLRRFMPVNRLLMKHRVLYVTLTQFDSEGAFVLVDGHLVYRQDSDKGYHQVFQAERVAGEIATALGTVQETIDLPADAMRYDEWNFGEAVEWVKNHVFQP